MKRLPASNSTLPAASGTDCRVEGGACCIFGETHTVVPTWYHKQVGGGGGRGGGCTQRLCGAHLAPQTAPHRCRCRRTPSHRPLGARAPRPAERVGRSGAGGGGGGRRMLGNAAHATVHGAQQARLPRGCGGAAPLLHACSTQPCPPPPPTHPHPTDLLQQEGQRLALGGSRGQDVQIFSSAAPTPRGTACTLRGLQRWRPTQRRAPAAATASTLLPLPTQAHHSSLPSCCTSCCVPSSKPATPPVPGAKPHL